MPQLYISESSHQLLGMSIPSNISAMSYKLVGKANPLKQPKVEKKDYNEVDMAKIQKMKEEERRSGILKQRPNRRGPLEMLGLRRVGRNENSVVLELKLQTSEVFLIN